MEIIGSTIVYYLSFLNPYRPFTQRKRLVNGFLVDWQMILVIETMSALIVIIWTTIMIVRLFRIVGIVEQR